MGQSRRSRDIRDRSAHRPTSVDLSALFGGRSAPIAKVDQKIISMQTSHLPSHAPVEAGYSHSIATIMTNAAVHTGAKVTFDATTQNVMADGKAFLY